MYKTSTEFRPTALFVRIISSYEILDKSVPCLRHQLIHLLRMLPTKRQTFEDKEHENVSSDSFLCYPRHLGLKKYVVGFEAD